MPVYPGALTSTLRSESQAHGEETAQAGENAC
jgi:hypothetical protein